MRKVSLIGCIICQGIAWITVNRKGKSIGYCKECYNNEYSSHYEVKEEE